MWWSFLLFVQLEMFSLKGQLSEYNYRDMSCYQSALGKSCGTELLSRNLRLCVSVPLLQLNKETLGGKWRENWIKMTPVSSVCPEDDEGCTAVHEHGKQTRNSVSEFKGHKTVSLRLTVCEQCKDTWRKRICHWMIRWTLCSTFLSIWPGKYHRNSNKWDAEGLKKDDEEV